MARLRAAWPAAQISWLVNPEWAPLLDANPDINEVVQFPRQEFRGLGGLRKLYPWARRHVIGRRPDLALDFQGLLRTALLGRLTGAHRLSGLSDAREGATFLYNHVVPAPAGHHRHAVDRYLALADDAVGHIFDARGASLQFPLPAGDPVQIVGTRLQPDFIVLHPFARGTNKSLPAEQVHAFCARLQPRQIVLVGRHDSSFTAPPGTVDLLNQTTIPQLIWILRRAAFVISVDSGPMHLAAALGRPLVAIHTWSNPLRVGPYRSDAWVWKNGRLLQVGEINAGGDATIEDSAAAATLLSAAHINAICSLATSPSYSCA